MQQQTIHNYLERYFQANECEIVDNDGGKLNVQLSVELDKLLMNRPFYWHYLEKTGGNPNPMKLSLFTQKQKEDKQEKGEFIHFGSPRLHQIFQSAKKLAAYIRLYEEVEANGGAFVPLHPWVCLNVKISYQCDRKKDMLRSIGLNLVTGKMVEDFHKRITEQKNLMAKIPDYCYTLTPLIKPASGLKRIESYVSRFIEQDDHLWADEARQRWDEDQKLLDHFYEGIEELPECYHVEKEALRTQYEPRIKVSIINGGKFFLSADPS